MALGEGVRESTLERFKEGRAPDGRRWKPSLRAATPGGKTLIPARPFLGLSDEDMQEIKATTEEFIGRDD